MSKRFKNALRKHYIAPFDTETPDTPPTSEQYMWIANGIKESAPENNEEDDDVAYFDGDGTPEKIITSKTLGRSFEGERRYGDKAQDYVASLEAEDGDALAVWYKEISPDKKTQKEGPARLSAIEIGDGEASEVETIAFQVAWSRKPVVSQVVTEEVAAESGIQ